MTHPQGGPQGHETQLYKALMTENNFILLSYLLRLDKVFYSGLKKPPSHNSKASSSLSPALIVTKRKCQHYCLHNDFGYP